MPRFFSLRRRFVVAASIVAATLAGIGTLLQHGGAPSRNGPAEKTPSSPTSTADAATPTEPRSEPAPAKTKGDLLAELSREPPPEEADLSPASWLNPFEADLWRCRSADVNHAILKLQAADESRALFLRRFRKLMAEVHAQPAETATFAVELFSPETQSVTSIVCDLDEVRVIHERDTRETLIAQRPIRRDAATSALVVRVAATGNRLIVSVGDRHVLTCEQPAAQAGRELMPAFRSLGAAVEITALRLEGE